MVISPAMKIRGIVLIACFVAVSTLIVVRSSLAGSADEEYTKARECYSALKADPELSKSRERWEYCISMFERVAREGRNQGEGELAAYSVGKLRLELYSKLKDKRDLDSAVAAFNIVVKDFSKSSLADDALFQIGTLRLNSYKQKDKAAKAFGYIVESYPDGDKAAAAKKMLAKLGSDPATAQIGAQAVAEKGSASEGEGSKIATNPFEGKVATPLDQAVLAKISIDKGDAASTVTMVLTKKVAYSLEFTEQGLRTKSPAMLDLLLSSTEAPEGVEKEFPVDSPFLAGFSVKRRMLQSGVKVEFQLGENATYELVPDKQNIILKFKRDGKILKQKGGAEPQKVEPSERDSKLEGANGKPGIKKGFAGLMGFLKDEKRPGEFRIVIDPGHGGSDSGAVGPKGTLEKDVDLIVAKGLAREFEKRLRAKVYLTRNRDKDLTLEDRNRIAVEKQADIFISVHANAALDPKQSGFETYFLNNASDKAAAKLAARENKVAGKKLPTEEHILSTMMQNYDAARSQGLASDVHRSVVSRMGKAYPGLKDRSVKSALFYVLVGAKCPAILVETSFISNPKEERRLLDPNYQQDLAGSIADGVKKYIEQGDKQLVAL